MGKSAPWFLLALMLFSYAVRSISIESSSMFVRGGVYRVVKEAMGSTLAKFSVSALLFDYVLTGPISAVSAGQYLAGFFEEMGTYLHHPLSFNENHFSAVFGVLVVVYFWWKNTQGIHESSEKALQIMIVTTVMVVILIAWCTITVFRVPIQIPPNPLAAGVMKLNKESLGWLYGTWFSHLTLIILFVGFGHSVLAMSGEETLAQVNREIEHPKLKNLEKAGLVIFLYSLLFTSLVSFFAVMIIPDKVRPDYFANLISGLAMHMVGPYTLKLFFQGFVVLVGVLILSGAVNTAIVGANGVINRISEDGVLTPWIRKPHGKYGTTYRVINLITFLQIFTILASRGNVYLLASLYAFGVIWSFSFMSLAVLVLRFIDPEGREFKVPGNLKIGHTELPIGLALISLLLFATAFTNLFTKRLATISGIAFSAFLFVVFTVTEKITHRKAAGKSHEIEKFRVHAQDEVNAEDMHIRPGNILVAVRDTKNLYYLRELLCKVDTNKTDVVVMTARVLHRVPSFSGATQMDSADVFEEYEQELFTTVVNLAEKEGKHVSLMVVPTNDVFEAIMATAQRLGSTLMVCGLSNKLTPEEQAKLTGDAWERLPDPKPRVKMEVVAPDGRKWEYTLGPHAPRLRPQDLKLMHDIWLELTRDPRFNHLHHYHVVSVALQELANRLHGTERDSAISELEEEVDRDDDT